MALYRVVFAGLIALGLALAPIGAALAAGHAMAKPAMEDCHGKPAKNCPCCDTANCSTELCLVKCYKLLGTMPGTPVLLALAIVLDEPADPQEPPNRSLRPHPPPPRS